MTKKSRKLVLPKECSRCQTEAWSQEELVMYGRYGTFGKGWRFWAFICQEWAIQNSTTRNILHLA
jgi:hypothetical protein